MKNTSKTYIVSGLILITVLNTSACSTTANPPLLTIENPPAVTVREVSPIPETNHSEKIPDDKMSYDSTKTLSENITILNQMLDDKYQKQMTVVTAKEYESSDRSDWMLILDGDKAGVDTASWKYNYDPDSPEGIYMDAVLTTFVFFYEEEMGDSLWRLTGDLLDDGADETEYGFKHDGGQVVFKDCRAATYGYADNDENYNISYLWMTPGVIGEYKDVID